MLIKHFLSKTTLIIILKFGTRYVEHNIYIYIDMYIYMYCNLLWTGPKVRGFDPDRGRWIFKGDKNPEHNFLRRGSKAVSPLS
jgi:hypothetical protein